MARRHGNDRRPRLTDRGGSRAWSLVLPGSRRVLCHSARIPELLRDMAMRGTCVDVVHRTPDGSAAMNATVSGLRLFTKVDPNAVYDVALLWDPRATEDLDTWLADVSRLVTPPTELAVWSRNPWGRERLRRVPSWRSIDRRLRRNGWRPSLAHVGLPRAERVRHIVDWGRYTRSTVAGASPTVWKRWVTRRGLMRWFLPVRLRRATRAGVEPGQSLIQDLLASVSEVVGAPLRLQDLRISPNGLAIAQIGVGPRIGGTHAILKVPFASDAKERSRSNADGLQWFADHAPHLGSWSQAAPRLLGRGSANDCSWSLEEYVHGTPAQSWRPEDAERAMSYLVGFLETLARLGAPPQLLDAQLLDEMCGAHVRHIVALLQPALAQRLQSLWAEAIAALEGVVIALAPRHGDFKLENVLGDSVQPERLRILDWELWTSRGLPLLDALHLVLSRRRVEAGVTVGGAIRRSLLAGHLSGLEHRMLRRIARNVDPRYVQVTPLLYWLDRVGPIAARGQWPSRDWEEANVVQTLAQLKIDALGVHA